MDNSNEGVLSYPETQYKFKISCSRCPLSQTSQVGIANHSITAHVGHGIIYIIIGPSSHFAFLTKAVTNTRHYLDGYWVCSWHLGSTKSLYHLFFINHGYRM